VQEGTGGSNLFTTLTAYTFGNGLFWLASGAINVTKGLVSVNEAL